MYFAIANSNIADFVYSLLFWRWNDIVFANFSIKIDSIYKQNFLQLIILLFDSNLSRQIY